MEMEYPPFEFVGEDGNPDGVSVRMAEALGEYLRRPVRLENTKFDSLITALKSGKIDLIISSMTATDERRESITFSDPYVTTGIAMLVPKDSDIQGPNDLKRPGIKIVAKLGTTGESYARANLPDAEVLALPEDPVCALEVAQGKADAWIYDQLSIFNHHKQHPKTTRAILEPIRAEQWAVGLRQNDTELRDQVNAFLKQFREGGGFDTLAGRYLKEEKALMDSMGVPFIFDSVAAVKTSDATVQATDSESDFLFVALMAVIIGVGLIAFWRLTRTPITGRTSDTLGFVVLWMALAGIAYFVIAQLGETYTWNWAGIWRRRWEIFGGWMTTIGISLASLVLCSVLAILLVAGGRAAPRPVRFLCQAYTEIMRGSPLIVVLLVGYYVIGNAFGVENRMIAGILLLSLFTSAYLGEILRGGIESIGRTQFESARAVGFDRIQAYRYVILPQAIRRVLPAVAGLFIILIKDSSLLSYIGTEEFKKVADNARSATFTGLEAYLPMAIGYLAMTIPLAWVAKRMERRFAYES